MRKQILIVEDDHDARVALRQVFEELDFNVVSAANGKDGLKALKISGFNLIILDLMMPLMNGEEFLKEKCSHPEWSKIPTIVSSAFQDRLEKVESPIKLKKPFDLDELSNIALSETLKQNQYSI